MVLTKRILLLGFSDDEEFPAVTGDETDGRIALLRPDSNNGDGVFVNEYDGELGLSSGFVELESCRLE